MRTAAIIPVKSFARAKTRLGLPGVKKEELCRVMLEEVLRTVVMSPRIDEAVVVTADPGAAEIARACGASVLESPEEGVNSAVRAADSHLEKRGFDCSIVVPQDIPYVKVQDIDFVMGHMAPPTFAIVVPSRKFDGTNALVRMPVSLMGTSYDEDSYRNHMRDAQKHTPNASLVFSRRIMMDIDTPEDLKYALENPEKPDVAKRMGEVAG